MEGDLCEEHFLEGEIEDWNHVVGKTNVVLIVFKCPPIVKLKAGLDPGPKLVVLSRKALFISGKRFKLQGMA